MVCRSRNVTGATDNANVRHTGELHGGGPRQHRRVAGPDRNGQRDETVAGGEPLGFFLTFGQYDLVAFSEMPDDETTAKVQLTSAMEGNVETETLRAFTMDELGELLDELPE